MIGSTHRSPAANIVVTKIFFFKGTCNFHTHGIGRIRIAKSDVMLKKPLARYKAFAFRQWPVCSHGFQIFSRGLHKAIMKITWARSYTKLLQMQT